MEDAEALPVPRMHAGEVEVDHQLVRSLLRAQMPELADLPLRRVAAWGTDHVIYRLGERWSVRLPKIHWAADQGDHEQRWLPTLAPHLPAEVPVPHAVGAPAFGYPYRWYVSPWLEGDHPTPEDPSVLPRLAAELAGFVKALQAIGADGAPTPGSGHRGGLLAGADDFVREHAEQLRGETDVEGLLAVWEAGHGASPWRGEGVWIHGDLSDGNLLLRDGRLAAVLDWGELTAGDPAADLMVAWSLFDPPSRTAYREALGFVDDAMWLRGRAWAVYAAVLALPYYRDTNPDIVGRSWRTVRAVLRDLEEGT